MKTYPIFVFLCALFIANSLTAQTIPYSTGRIAVSCDGNMHDPDDKAATPATLAMLASQDLQDKLTLYVYSDHVWGSSTNGAQHMEDAVNGCKDKFGFDTTLFLSGVDDPSAAYNAMRDAILASTSSDPLTVICAGPMEVIGEGLRLAKAVDASPLQYVRLITHSLSNNQHADTPRDTEPAHSGWHWDEMVAEFSADGVTFEWIADQNSGDSIDIGFNTGSAGPDGAKTYEPWYFLRDYATHTPAINEGIQFIYTQMINVAKRADFSDAGIAYYLITGDEQGGPVGLAAMLDNGFAGLLASEVTLVATDFPVLNAGEVNFTVDATRGALQINSNVVSNRDKFARATMVFSGDDGDYVPELTTMQEVDGESRYRLWVDGVLIGEVINDTTSTDYALQVHTFPAVTLTSTSVIGVEAMAVSNETVAEGEGFAYARGRWTQITFNRVSDDLVVQAGPDREIQLPTDSLTLDGSVSGPIDTITWSQVSGPNAATLGVTSLEDLAVSGLVAGSYVFRMSGLDTSGVTKTDDVFVYVGSAANIWQESNGVVIMEAERTTSNLDQWIEATDYSTYTGEGYIEFTGNSPTSGPATSPLVYEFRITTPGYYYMHLHCAKLAQVVNGEQRSDVANDCYVKMTGDYGTGPNVGDSHGDDANMSILSRNTKFFGGSSKRFSWAPDAADGGNGSLDPGGERNKRIAIYNFKAGEVYRLTVSGRSQDFCINRIMLRHVDTSFAEVTDLAYPESTRAGLTVNAGSDQVISIPTTSLSLNGSVWGTATSIGWAQVSGPNAATLSGQSTDTLAVSGLVEGAYVFSLSASHAADTVSDQVTVTVQPPQPPSVDAGADQEISLPQTSLTLEGSVTDVAALTSVAWVQLSGPVSTTMTGADTATLSVSDLVEGSYVFQLAATNEFNLSSLDPVTVTVRPMQTLYDLSPEADTYVHSGKVASNYGADMELACKIQTGYDRSVFLRFSLPVIPVGLGIQRAVLKLNVTSTNGTAGSHTVHSVADDSWDELTLTSGNQPSIGAELDRAVPPVVGEWIELDVTSQLKQEADSQLSLAMISTDSVLVTYASREAAVEVRPVLRIEVAAAPTFESALIDGGSAWPGVRYAGSVAETASNLEGSSMTYSKISGPNWLSVATDGSLSGIPDVVDVGLSSFTIQVEDDSGLSDTATLNIQVSGLSTDINFVSSEAYMDGSLQDHPNWNGYRAGTITDAAGSGLVGLSSGFGVNLYTSALPPAQQSYTVSMTFTFTEEIIDYDAKLLVYAGIASSVDPETAELLKSAFCRSDNGYCIRILGTGWKEGLGFDSTSIAPALVGINVGGGDTSSARLKLVTVITPGATAGDWAMHTTLYNLDEDPSATHALIDYMAVGIGRNDMFDASALFAVFGDPMTDVLASVSDRQVDQFGYSVELISDFAKFERDYTLSEGPNGDDDGDGRSNFYEFAFGGIPNDASQHGQPMRVEFLGDHVRFYHDERLEDSGLIYEVQWQTDLAELIWFDAWDSVTSSSSTDPDFLEFCHRLEVEGHDQIFMRVKARQR